MAISIQAFNRGLYEEHLLEASFLYAQRLAYLKDLEVEWPSLQSIDDRLEAHLDALVVGGESALGLVRSRETERDPGEVHTAIRLFCRHGLKEDALRAVAIIPAAAADGITAAAGALRAELPPQWLEDIVRQLDEGSTASAVFAHVLGYKRTPVEPQLLRLSGGASGTGGSVEIAWSLGRVGSVASCDALRRMAANTNDPDLARTAAVALLRVGDDWPVASARASGAGTPVHQHVLGLGGDPTSVPLLLTRLGDAPDPSGTILALGLLGDMTAVGPLLALLSDEALARPAAIALNTMTGAGLHSRVFVPYRFDPDELSEEERAAFERDGSLPMRAGEPFGTWEHTPQLDPTAWREWFDRHKHHFQLGLRWRAGLPYGPEALVRCLAEPSTPHVVREATYDELVIRYRLDVPFEADLPVGLQWRSLSRLEQWAASNAAAFTRGGWFFAGRRQA